MLDPLINSIVNPSTVGAINPTQRTGDSSENQSSDPVENNLQGRVSISATATAMWQLSSNLGLETSADGSGHFQSQAMDQYMAIENFTGEEDQGAFSFSGFSAEDNKKLDDLFNQYDKLADKDKLTAEDEKSLASLEGKIEQVFAKYDASEDDLSEQEFLDELGMSQQDKDKYGKITAQMDDIFSDGTVTKSEQKTLDSLEKELDSLIQPYEEKLIAQEENEFLDAIGMSDEDKKQYQALNAQLDSIFEDDKVTKEEEKTLAETEKKLDTLFEKYDAQLTKLEDEYEQEESEFLDSLGMSDEDKKQYKALNAQLDKLFEDDNLTEAEEKTLNEIEGKLDSLFGKYEEQLARLDEEALVEDEKAYLSSLNMSDKDKSAYQDINNKLDSILAKQQITDKDDKQIAALDKQLVDLLAKYENKKVS